MAGTAGQTEPEPGCTSGPVWARLWSHAAIKRQDHSARLQWLGPAAGNMKEDVLLAPLSSCSTSQLWLHLLVGLCTSLQPDPQQVYLQNNIGLRKHVFLTGWQVYSNCKRKRLKSLWKLFNKDLFWLKYLCPGNSKNTFTMQLWVSQYVFFINSSTVYLYIYTFSHNYWITTLNPGNPALCSDVSKCRVAPTCQDLDLNPSTTRLNTQIQLIKEV